MLDSHAGALEQTGQPGLSKRWLKCPMWIPVSCLSKTHEMRPPFWILAQQIKMTRSWAFIFGGKLNRTDTNSQWGLMFTEFINFIQDEPLKVLKGGLARVWEALWRIRCPTSIYLPQILELNFSNWCTLDMKLISTLRSCVRRHLAVKKNPGLCWEGFANHTGCSQHT